MKTANELLISYTSFLLLAFNTTILCKLLGTPVLLIIAICQFKKLCMKKDMHGSTPNSSSSTSHCWSHMPHSFSVHNNYLHWLREREAYLILQRVPTVLHKIAVALRHRSSQVVNEAKNITYLYKNKTVYITKIQF